MMRLFYFTRLAIQNLRRGGQRVLVALLCISFGIAALVSLTMIAHSIESAILLTPAQLIGGDISMVRKDDQPILSKDIDQLDALQQSGEISDYTLIALSSSIMFHTSDSGEMYFAGGGFGVEPEKYPLAGGLQLGEPVNATLPTLLRQAGDVVVTRDLAEEHQLMVGDLIVLADARSRHSRDRGRARHRLRYPEPPGR